MNKKMINKYILGAIITAPATMIINDINKESVVLAEDGTAAATAAVATAEGNPTTATIKTARDLVNALPESANKDILQGKLNKLYQLSDLVLKRLNASANVDVYIKCENIVSLSLSSSSITFDDFGGQDNQTRENAVILTVNSSLPYDVNAYLPEEIMGVEGNRLDRSIFQIKANGESQYQTFNSVGTAPQNKITLLSGQDDTVNKDANTHGIDINLRGGQAHAKDIYRATIKFEVAQN